MEESISLEETNKIRISLGLKPLTDDKAPANNKEKEAEDNYAKRREEERQEAERKCAITLHLVLVLIVLPLPQEDRTRHCKVSMFLRMFGSPDTSIEFLWPLGQETNPQLTEWLMQRS